MEFKRAELEVAEDPSAAIVKVATA